MLGMGRGEGLEEGLGSGCQGLLRQKIVTDAAKG